MARANPEAISPTAHYTGYVWFANGHSHPAFATRQGQLMYQSLRAPNVIARATGLPTLEGMLLARHQLIDRRLEQAIDAGEISQVVEVAAGLSPRGWRFAQRYGSAITYVEADLPGMLANKRRILAALGGETPTHYTREVDALSDTSLAAICAHLDPTRGTAIITEGLVNYFDRQTVLAIWRRIADALARFPRGIYLSDLILREANTGVLVKSFAALLSLFVRGRVHMHFTTSREAEAALASVGLDGALLDPRDFDDIAVERAGAARVKIVEASARGAQKLDGRVSIE